MNRRDSCYTTSHEEEKMGIFQEFSNARLASKVANKVAEKLGIYRHQLPMTIQELIFNSTSLFKDMNLNVDQAADLMIETMNSYESKDSM